MGTETEKGIYKPADNEFGWSQQVRDNFDIWDQLMDGWAKPKWVFEYVSSTQFKVVGDKTTYYKDGRRIKAELGGAWAETRVSGDATYDGGTNRTTVNLLEGKINASLTYIMHAPDMGGEKAALRYEHTQTVAASLWVVQHNFGVATLPTVRVFAETEIQGNTIYCGSGVICGNGTYCGQGATLFMQEYSEILPSKIRRVSEILINIFFSSPQAGKAITFF